MRNGGLLSLARFFEAQEKMVPGEHTLGQQLRLASSSRWIVLLFFEPACLPLRCVPLVRVRVRFFTRFGERRIL